MKLPEIIPEDYQTLAKVFWWVKLFFFFVMIRYLVLEHDLGAAALSGVAMLAAHIREQDFKKGPKNV